MFDGSAKKIMRALSAGEKVVRNGVIVFLAALATAPVSAQISDPYQALIAEMVSEEALETTFRQLMEVDFPAAFLSDPDIAELEQECPGVVQALLAAATPLFSELNDEGLIEYRAALHDLLTTRMSAADARQAADFFASDVGRRFIRAISAETSLSNSLASAMSNDEGSIDRSAFERDQQSAALDGIAALSDADLRAVNQAMGTSSWGKAIAGLSDELTELKYRITNADLTPEREAALEALMTETVDAHVEACPALGD